MGSSKTWPDPRRGIGATLGGRDLVVITWGTQIVVLGFLVLVAPGRLVTQGVLATIAVMAMFNNGVLSPQIYLSALDRGPRVASAFAIATGVVGAVLAFVGLPVLAVDALRFGPLAMFVSWCALALTYYVGIAGRRRGRFRDRVIVLGSGQVADRMNLALRQNPAYGLDVVGHMAPAADDSVGSTPRLGPPEGLLSMCHIQRAEVVIVAYSQATESQLLGPVRECAASQIRVLVVPRFFEEIDRQTASDEVWGVPLQRLPMPTSGRTRRTVKRSLDVAVAGVAFVLLLPVMAICAFAVKRETGSGVLFRQMRVGQNERPIQILKFQTLKPATSAESDTRWNISHDERLGPIGRVLRRTSLDELPQLWNVLRGDMSLVGPRPERPYFVAQFKEEFPSYGARHRVPVGLTGLAQVNELRGNSSIEERARFDNAYAASWSPWQDVKILLRTVPEVIKGSGG